MRQENPLPWGKKIRTRGQEARIPVERKSTSVQRWSSHLFSKEVRIRVARKPAYVQWGSPYLCGREVYIRTARKSASV